MRKIACFVICLLITGAVFSQPVITSFEPVSGSVGTPVTIHGTGFHALASDNTVFFGVSPATVSAATDTTLFVQVPSGATYQPITVTVSGATATSLVPFIPTFPGGDNSFSAASFLPAVHLNAGNLPHCVLEADFDKDGRNDILVSRGSSGQLSVFPNTSSPGNFTFGPRLDFPATGFDHEGAAVGDIDGDGLLDVLLTNSYGTYSVSVFRNTSTPGAISFENKIDFPADNGPYAVTLGDLNGDGKPEMIIANNGGTDLNIYPNTSTPGTISFGASVSVTAGTNPFSVICQDIDNDGKPDLVFTTQGTGNSLSILKNTSTADTLQFEAPVGYANVPAPFTVYAGDLDNDGKPDLAAASSAGQIIVLRNSSTPGTIGFDFSNAYSAGSYPVCVTMGDLNGDGKPDLVTANRFGNSVTALRNTSTGGAVSFDNNIEYSTGPNPIYVTCGDLDGDGRPDLITANSSDSTITLLRNIIGLSVVPVINGFTPASGISGTSVTITGINFTGATSVKFGGVEAASFTVDSATGITAVPGEGASGEVSVTTPTGTASLAGFVFNGPLIHSFSPMVGVTGTVVNISGENFTGATEVKFGVTPAASFTINSAVSITAIVGPGSNGSVTVTTPNGTATKAGFSFGPPVINSFSPVYGPVGSVMVINGNNFGNTPAANIVYMGAVRATVIGATPTQLVVIVPAGANYQPITVTTNNRTAASATSFAITYPAPDRTITDTSFVVVSNLPAGAYPTAVFVKDMNNDGKPDILAVNSSGNSLSVFKNTGTDGLISFSPKLDFATGTGPKQLAVADLDGDGLPDVVVSDFNSGGAAGISLFRNTSTNGTISLSPKTDYPTGNGSLGVSVGDLDKDGRPDIIVSSGNSGYFSYFKNITDSVGHIMLAYKQDITLMTHPDNNVIGDFDGDGRPDLAFSNFSNNSISIFPNSSSGGVFSLGNQVDLVAGSHPSYITQGDLNIDGQPDLLLTNYSDTSFSIYRNTGNGTIAFDTPVPYAIPATNISLEDLNGDGKPDLCTGRGLKGFISVLQNTLSNPDTLSFGGNIDFVTGNYDTFTGTGDLNGDGKPEIIVANSILGTVSVLRNRIYDPEITALSSISAESGTTVNISGKNLSGASSVKFGGVAAASFTVVSDSLIDAELGDGASGDITIATPIGFANMPGFQFIPHVSASGDTVLCGSSSVTLNSSAGANNQWYKNGTAISGATGKTYSATSSGNYTVSTTSNGITTVSPTGIMVSITTVPTPVISLNVNTLVSSAASGNQWYLNGNPIAGATNASYQPTQSGIYNVKTTVNQCSSSFSAPYNFVYTGIINLGNGQFIRYYPNPVKNSLMINWNLAGVTKLQMKMMDLNGRMVYSTQNLSNGTPVNISTLPAGLYLVNLSDQKNTLVRSFKIIKQ